MHKGAARLADQIALRGQATSCRIESGVISAYAGGVATVTWRGEDVQAPHLASYVPTVGHVVLLLVQPPQIVIVDRLTGTP